MKDLRFRMVDARWVAGVVLAVMLAVPLWAQVQTVQTAQPAIDGFVPMSEAAPREVLPATPLVFYAYAFVWLALIGYVAVMWRRMARVERELAAVQRRLQEHAGGR